MPSVLTPCSVRPAVSRACGHNAGSLPNPQSRDGIGSTNGQHYEMQADLNQLACDRGRASRKTPLCPSPRVEWQERNSLPGIAAPPQNIRSAGLSVPNDPTFAIAKLIRIWLSLRASPIESLRSSTLKPQQSVLYVTCEMEYRNIDCR